MGTVDKRRKRMIDQGKCTEGTTSGGGVQEVEERVKGRKEVRGEETWKI